MFDNGMTGAVGFVMHEDRLAKATRNLQIIEAKQATKRGRRSADGTYRAVMARMLVGRAARIAPTVTVPTTGTGALVR